MTVVLRVAGFVMLAGLLSSCTSSMPASSPTQVPSVAPASSAPEPPTPPTPAPPTPVMPYVYSGIVTDGTGRPVVGATVRGGPDSGITDANGRYEFRSPYDKVPGNVYPPVGYERKPVHYHESFPLSAGGQNISIRRITSVTMSPPPTLKVGEYGFLFPRISFDTGQVESPKFDYFERSVSDPTVLKFDGVVNAAIEAIKPGTVLVTGSYLGVSAGTAQIQVVP